MLEPSNGSSGNSDTPAAARKQGYDMAVAYRIYPKVTKAAQSLPFGDDKLRQAEVCLQSFRKSLGSLRVKIWAILDGCPPEYLALFERYFAPEDLVPVIVDSLGNKGTFARQLDILLAQRDCGFVYLAEDDYLYLPGQFEMMLEFLRGGPHVDFVSPYDHLDCYRLDLHHEAKWVTVFAEHHWRTAASTCLTFLTRQSSLARYERVFRTFSRGNDDCALWLSLTKRRIFDPFAMIRFLSRGEFYWKSPLKSWLFCWRQIILGRTAKLWIPIPGIATHLSAGLLSPGVDWLSILQGDGVRLAEPGIRSANEV